ncbi:MAG TPA: peptidylprolyl isomerase [Polyangia bacterium]|nr:peptidylprolyl isomerase [Polyangia bacterium]
MLEALRKNSKNTIITILFAVIIAVFVLNFGPGSRGCGDAAGTGYAAKVAGETIPEADFRYAYRIIGGDSRPSQFARFSRLKETVMDALIERELLAQEAERLGINVSEKEAVELLVDRKMFFSLGQQYPLPAYVLTDGVLNTERLKSWTQNQLGLTERRFIDQQLRELMADRVRQLVFAGTQLLPDEVKEYYEQSQRQVNLQFVRFQPSRYKEELELSPADIAAYKTAHPTELKKYYEEHSYLYKKLGKEARIRRVLAVLPPDAKPDVEAKAKAKAEDALKRLQAGEKFEAVAKALSDDTASRTRGGSMGWRKKGQTGLGQAVEDQVFAAQKGALLGPLKSDLGYEVLRVEDFREGDVPLEAVADEIAEEQLRTERSNARAKADAEQALAKVQGGASLEQLYPKPTDADESDPAKRVNPPPAAQETGMFARRGDLVPDIGVSPEVTKKAFEMKVGDVAGPFEASGSWVVIRLKERKEPDMSEFAKRQAAIAADYRRRRGTAQVDGWVLQRCMEARNAGRIDVNDEVMSYEGGNPALRLPGEQKYEPCSGGRAPGLPGSQFINLGL